MSIFGVNNDFLASALLAISRIMMKALAETSYYSRPYYINRHVMLPKSLYVAGLAYFARGIMIVNSAQRTQGHPYSLPYSRYQKTLADENVSGLMNIVNKNKHKTRALPRFCKLTGLTLINRVSPRFYSSI